MKRDFRERCVLKLLEHIERTRKEKTTKKIYKRCVKKDKEGEH